LEIARLEQQQDDKNQHKTIWTKACSFTPQIGMLPLARSVTTISALFTSCTYSQFQVLHKNIEQVMQINRVKEENNHHQF
jgi:hypothetical protein